MTTVKGWCPGALRPMQSADGWLLRIRPMAGRLTHGQITQLIPLLDRYGIGGLSLSNRANLQLRGLSAGDIPALQDELRTLGLIDPDPETETRRNIVMTPYATAGDVNARIHTALCAALAQMPPLPAKFGFAVDCGDVRCLGSTPADIRFERARTGIMLRADGADMGTRCTDVGQAVAYACDLAAWFAMARLDMPDQPRRMRGLLAAGLCPPLPADTAPAPNRTPDLPLLYAPFGEVSLPMLAALGTDIRITPWRAVLPDMPVADAAQAGWITDGAAAMLRVTACPGAPHCAAASVATRDLARALAADLPHGRHLHVSGCAKHCAAHGPQDITLTGHDGAFDLTVAGRPLGSGLPPDTVHSTLSAYFRDPHAPHL